ncbi:MAG: hypothetical protein M1814_004317 [Vezdaea aestivalis]|nr:MAG: hypothetical protein M1814_004317 [Vezdaea aestivalis]
MLREVDLPNVFASKSIYIIKYSSRLTSGKKNERFNSYCPFCQIAASDNPLPQGLREPPPYSPPQIGQIQERGDGVSENDQPPPYSSEAAQPHRRGRPSEDVLHYVDFAHDSLPSLALRYRVPLNILRHKNGLFSDHLISARKTILIPGEYYCGPSLSPKLVEGEEEELRKSKVRRWMLACKVAEYDVALIYLDQCKYDLDQAIDKYLADEKWERENPLKGSSSHSMRQ